MLPGPSSFTSELWKFAGALGRVFVERAVYDRECVAYRRFSEFAAPRTVRKLVYGRDVGTITRDAAGTYTVDPDNGGAAKPFSFGDPNFTYRSLRGTAVLRWEYRPGSTVFFVWTQQRSGVDPFGDFQFRRDYPGIFHDRPDNVFLVKATWWIGR